MQTRQTVKSKHYALHQYADGRIEIEALSTKEVLPVPPDELDVIMLETYIEAVHSDANGIDIDEADWPVPPWEED